MSRRCTFRSRPLQAVTARRLTLAALVATIAWTAAAQDASASPAAHSAHRGAAHVVTGNGGGGGEQVASGGSARARQSKSGNGRFNQNLNGVFAPTFMIGQQQTGITNGGRVSTQGAFCGPGPRLCKIWQNMPITSNGW
ncbi:hypothetical protein [Microbispora sp. H13382]|uniref:hypothetical protein n=1 Tax=Microbispora sp. H13382 TaxID=2729112 RepID=UPI0016044DDC|nr:hypothetical protein [Microbispora sp. H13382]